MVEDGLDGRHPGWRLRLSVARAGLRERGHQGRLASQRAARLVLRGFVGKWGTFLVAGYVIAILPFEFKVSSAAGQGWHATAALDALAAVVVLGGVAVLADGLLALPAFGRFLRRGGWPQIRRRVAWAAGATAAAGGGLAALVLISGSMTYDQLSGSWVFFLGAVGTGLLLAVAFGLWAYAAKATARHLDLAPRIRVGEMLLAAVTATAISVSLPISLILAATIQPSFSLLLVGVAALAAQSAVAAMRMQMVVRRGRRIRSAPGRAR